MEKNKKKTVDKRAEGAVSRGTGQLPRTRGQPGLTKRNVTGERLQWILLSNVYNITVIMQVQMQLIVRTLATASLAASSKPCRGNLHATVRTLVNLVRYVILAFGTFLVTK